MNDAPSSRRVWLKLAAGAAVTLPLAGMTAHAQAAQNAATRNALKYQDKPNAGAQCSTCTHFVPGKTPRDLGGCKVIPGDTEISPTAWCIAYSKKA